ncbi:MAG TPA: hypothetical protein VF698_15585 [Thermoanaerobaculia bacterium]|jgi:hypothetical protein
MKITFHAVLLSLLSLCLAVPAFATCEADNVSSGYQGDLASGDMTDFAYILRSSQVPGCEQISRDKLYSKLGAMEQLSPSPWRQRWSGVSLSFVLSTGLILGGKNYLDDALDMRLAAAANNYVLTFADACGHTNGGWSNANTCFEEYAIATLGNGWKTAYYRLTGRGPWLTDRDNTMANFRSALSEQVACIHKAGRAYDTYKGYCNATLAELEADTNGTQGFELITLNHTYQIPAYAIGQMTHIAAGFVGLEVAQRPLVSANLNAFYKSMAREVWREGVAKATSTGAFGSNCRIVLNPGTTSASFSAATYGCWDLQKSGADVYRADHFPVARFYEKYQFPTDLRTGQTLNWNFQSANTSSFTNSAFYYPARYEAYVTMAKNWLDSRPAMRGTGKFRGALKRTPEWYMVNSGSNTTPTATLNAYYNPRSADAVFVVEDLTPGTPHLTHGDQVAIRNKDGYYWEATSGGGSTVVARYNYVTNAAKFTIEKWGPYTYEPIGHDDLFALRTNNGTHYLVAPVNGTLSATSTSAVTDEVFRLDRLKTD